MQAGLQLAFVEGFLEGEEVEKVRVLEKALGEAGVYGRQSMGKVRDGGALALVGAGLDLHRQVGPAPALLEGLSGVPDPRGKVLHLLNQDDIVAPAQLGDGR